MSNNTTDSWAPPGEDASDLSLERATLMYPIWGAFVFGINTLIFGICLHALMSGKPFRRISWFTVCYMTIMYALAVGYFWQECDWVLKMYVDRRNYPGGPLAYEDYVDWTSYFASATYVGVNAMSDAIMLFRCYMVWERSILIMVIPVLMWIASTVCSVFTTLSSSALDVTIPYFALTTSLNIVLTVLISFKLLKTRNDVRQWLGSQHSSFYTKVMIMIIESAMLNAVASITAMVTTATNDLVFNMALATHVQVLCICPELIIIRVAMRRHDGELLPRSASGAVLSVNFASGTRRSETSTTISLSKSSVKTAVTTTTSYSDKKQESKGKPVGLEVELNDFPHPDSDNEGIKSSGLPDAQA